MARENNMKRVPQRTISPLCIDDEDYDLDLTATVSDTDQIPGCSKTPSRTFHSSTLNLAAPFSYTGQLQGRLASSVRSSCSFDLHPIPNSSDLKKFGTTLGSLSVDDEFRGTKRKYSGDDDSGPRRKRQKILHQERGIKRKHSSDHTENKCKRLKRWHRTDSRTFTITCPQTCACQVGQSRIIPIKRRHEVATSLLKDVLKENIYVSASTHDIKCCEKQCYYWWC